MMYYSSGLLGRSNEINHDVLRTFLQKHYTCETAVLEIPQKDGGYTAFEVPNKIKHYITVS